MRAKIKLLVLSILPLLCGMQAQIGDRNFSPTNAITFVNLSTAALPSSSFSITSTGTAHFVAVVLDTSNISSDPTSVTVGSQSATEYPVCTTNLGYGDICLWYVSNSTGSQTTVTTNGSIYYAWVYEFSGTNTSSPMDSNGTCTSIGGGYCNAAVLPTIANEGTLAAFTYCTGSSSISGSPTSFSNQSSYYFQNAGEAVLSSSSVETAVMASAGGTNGCSGIIWSFL